jgi:tetratricopeptide (TPR) repeat protein
VHKPLLGFFTLQAVRAASSLTLGLIAVILPSGVGAATVSQKSEAVYQKNTGSCNINITSGGKSQFFEYSCVVIETPGRGFDALYSGLLDLLGLRSPSRDLPPDVQQALAIPDAKTRRSAITVLIENTLGKEKTLPELYFGRAQTLGNPDALEDYERAYILASSEPKFAIGYATALVVRAQFDKAKQVYKQFLASPPIDRQSPNKQVLRATAAMGLGRVQFSTFQFEEASKSYDNALGILAALNPNDPEVASARVVAQAEKASILLTTGHAREAAAAFDETIESIERGRLAVAQETRTALYLARAQLYLIDGDPAAARRMLAKVAEVTVLRKGVVLVSPARMMVLITESQLDLPVDPEKALKEAKEAVQIADQLNQSIVEDKLGASEAYRALAEAEETAGDYLNADKSIERSVSQIRDLIGTIPTQRALLAVRLSDQIELKFRFQDFDTAIKLANEAILLDRDASQAIPQLKMFYVQHLLALGKSYQAKGGWDSSEDPLKQAAVEAKTLAQGDRQFYGISAEVLATRALTEYAQGRADTGRAAFEDALAIIKTVAQTDPAAARRPIISALHTVCTGVHGDQDTLRLCESGIDVWRRLTKNDIDQMELSALLCQSAILHQDLGDLASARTRFEEAASIREKIASLNKTYLPDQAEVNGDLSRTLFQIGETASAEEQLTRGLKAAASAIQNERVKSLTALLSTDLVALYLADKRFTLAVDFGTRAEEGLRGLVKVNEGAYEGMLASLLGDIGEACREGQEPCDFEKLNEALSIYQRELSAGRPIDQQRMARTFNSLGIVLENRGDLGGSRRMFEGAAKAYRTLFSEDTAERENLLIVLRNLAHIYKRTNMSAKAATTQTEILRLSGKNRASKPKHPT